VSLERSDEAWDSGGVAQQSQDSAGGDELDQVVFQLVEGDGSSSVQKVCDAENQPLIDAETAFHQLHHSM